MWKRSIVCVDEVQGNVSSLFCTWQIWKCERFFWNVGPVDRQQLHYDMLNCLCYKMIWKKHVEEQQQIIWNGLVEDSWSRIYVGGVTWVLTWLIRNMYVPSKKELWAYISFDIDTWIQKNQIQIFCLDSSGPVMLIQKDVHSSVKLSQLWKHLFISERKKKKQRRGKKKEKKKNRQKGETTLFPGSHSRALLWQGTEWAAPLYAACYGQLGQTIASGNT